MAKYEKEDAMIDAIVALVLQDIRFSIIPVE